MYKNLPSLELAKKIVLTYFNGSKSELECNVQNTLVKTVKDKLDKPECPRDLFDGLYRQILTNISDTFSRFIGTFKYQNFEKRKRFFEDMQKN
jgi:hypothetical protein